jgi:2-methylcitrate dehydratase PrpD
MTLSADLIRLIRAKEIEEADLARAALFVLDTAANFIGGTNCDEGRRFLAWARATGHLTTTGIRGEPARATFLLGALAHSLEIDDLHRAAALHPGCVVVPVLWGRDWAASEGVDGKRALAAVLHGYEAVARIGMAVGPAHYKLWHNTATCGPFGAAMAAATLLGLDDDRCIDALGNAGTQSSGLWEFLSNGAMSKPIHAGHAAEAGLTAVELAQHGITGAPAILEGERGFFAAMCPDAEPELVLQEPDAPWQLHASSIKPWPSCRHTHPVIDASQELRRTLVEQKLGMEAVESIDIATYGAALDRCNNPKPDSVLAGKFSLQHCAAAALAFDEVWFEAFETDARRQLAPLRANCSVSVSQEMQNNYPQNWGAEVRIYLTGGEQLSANRMHAKGDPEFALDTDAMIAKASRLLSYGNVAEPMTFVESILAMQEGAPIPSLPHPLGQGSRPARHRQSDRAAQSHSVS